MKLALRVAVSLLTLTALVVLLPWEQLVAAAARLRPLVWTGVLVGFLAGHRIGVEKWRLLVNASGQTPLGSREAVHAYASGLFANLFLPAIVGGDVVRAILAARAVGRSAPVVLGGLADRVVDVVGLAALLSVGALLARASLPVGHAATAVVVLVGGTALGAGLLVWIVSRPLAAWPVRLRRPLGRGLVALRRLRRHPGRAATALAMSLAIQAGFVLLNAWIGASIGIDVPLAVWFLAWPLAKLVALVPVSLGGLGVRDATLGGLLGVWGVPVATGVVASLAWQSVVYGGGLLAGGWAYRHRREAALGV